MLALTIWEPWASLIMWGWKSIENRNWAPRSLRLDDRFAIHAGKWDASMTRERLYELPGGPELMATNTYQRGALLGTVCFAGVVRDESRLDADELQWWSGPLAWRLRHPVRCPSPLAMRGARGLWEVPLDAARYLGADC